MEFGHKAFARYYCHCHWPASNMTVTILSRSLRLLPICSTKLAPHELTTSIDPRRHCWSSSKSKVAKRQLNTQISIPHVIWGSG